MSGVSRRPLNPDEDRILRRLLGGWDGGADYLQQIPSLRVSRNCGCGCVSVEFESESPRDLDEPSRPLPVEADLLSEGGEPIGGVLVFESAGRISYLEAYSVEDTPISVWPPDPRIRVRVP